MSRYIQNRSKSYSTIVRCCSCRTLLFRRTKFEVFDSFGPICSGDPYSLAESNRSTSSRVNSDQSSPTSSSSPSANPRFEKSANCSSRESEPHRTRSAFARKSSTLCYIRTWGRYTVRVVGFVSVGSRLLVERFCLTGPLPEELPNHNLILVAFNNGLLWLGLILRPRPP